MGSPCPERTISDPNARDFMPTRCAAPRTPAVKRFTGTVDLVPLEHYIA